LILENHLHLRYQMLHQHLKHLEILLKDQ